MSLDFFAASNSAQGFKNYYGQCFFDCDRLFIVKGGPGTGKSTLMRRVAIRAEESGAEVERYYCSSDHTSLDGVRFALDGEVIGMLDGTFPHPYIEKHPGLCEEMINTGDFWDRRILCAYADRVRELCAKKSLEYELAYVYLRACGNLHLVSRTLDRGVTDVKKLDRIVERALGGLKRGRGYREMPVLVNSVGMKGEAHLDTLEREAQKMVVLCGQHSSDDFMARVRALAVSRELEIRVVYDPVFPDEINGIYFVDERVWVVCERACPEDIYERFGAKICRINQSRFISDTALPEHKKDARYATRMQRECRAQALSALARAGESHFELEEIYKSAMDFTALEEFSRDVCGRIFK